MYLDTIIRPIEYPGTVSTPVYQCTPEMLYHKADVVRNGIDELEGWPRQFREMIAAALIRRAGC